MPRSDFPQLDEAFAYLDEARKKVELEWDCAIVHDREIAEEAIIEAEKGYRSLRGITDPNEFKVAGHVAFWVRKLKPFRIFRLASFVAYLEERGLPHSFTSESCQNDLSGDPRALIVNEMIAVRAAVGIIRTNGGVFRPKPELVHDLIMSLRYHSFSPNAVRIILEGMAKNG